MQATPQSNRLTVSIFGRCNAGKSTLFNAITDTDNAIVSPLPGTTTDPVAKAMELLPHGPITLIDTAGLGDAGLLGEARMKKTTAVLDRTDLALYALSPEDCGSNLAGSQEDSAALAEFAFYKKEFQKRDIPCLVVITKKDLAGSAETDLLKERFPDALWVSAQSVPDMERLKATLAQQLDRLAEQEYPLLAGLLPAGAVAVLVIPIDSEAPKGRIILPQVQLIRECLDNGIRCHVTTDDGLADALAELRRVDLVVTDSQAFQRVDEIVPDEVPLTSFSILMARQKADLLPLEQGALALAHLEDGDRVLVAETCTHNRSHEDIGRVKLPRLLQKATGKALHFDFVAGRDYPENLADYKAVLHCGGCMITRKEMTNRLRAALEKGVAITNYGMALAWCNGILQRSTQILHNKEG